MHVVLITSMLRPVRDATVFSTEQRINQTLKTISTIRDKIPEAHIVMIEGGHIEPTEKERFSKLVDHLFLTDVTGMTKSPGEGTLLYLYLISDHFKSLKDVETVSKLSGRYYLNEYFNWNSLPLDKTTIGFISVAWMGQPLYKTRYYRIHKARINYFIEGLARYLKSRECALSWPDIEHCFYYHNLIKHDEVYSPDKIGVSGLISGTNECVTD